MKLMVFCLAVAFLYPLSILPFKILYVVSDLCFLLIFHVTGYRKKVVLSNLKNAFPDKSKEEIDRIAKKFYRNFCDILIEGVKFLTISRQQLTKRCTFENPELIDELCEQGKSAITTLGHCGNWEMAGLAASLMLKHHTIVFYRPLKNRYFDNLIRKTRERFGMNLVPDKKVREMIREEGKQPNLYIFITDQTPLNVHTSYWTMFLNQETPVFKGTEKIARITNHPVFFSDIKRIERGYYKITFTQITEDPSSMPENAITQKHTALLEEAIKTQPDSWLWSHRRWKRKRPTDIPVALQDDK